MLRRVITTPLGSLIEPDENWMKAVSPDPAAPAARRSRFLRPVYGNESPGFFATRISFARSCRGRGAG